MPKRSHAYYEEEIAYLCMKLGERDCDRRSMRRRVDSCVFAVSLCRLEQLSANLQSTIAIQTAELAALEKKVRSWQEFYTVERRTWDETHEALIQRVAAQAPLLPIVPLPADEDFIQQADALLQMVTEIVDEADKPEADDQAVAIEADNPTADEAVTVAIEADNPTVAVETPTETRSICEIEDNGPNV